MMGEDLRVSIIPDELCCAQVWTDSADGNAYKLTGHMTDQACGIVAAEPDARCWVVEEPFAPGRCEAVPIALIIAGQDRVALCAWDLGEHLEGQTLWVAPPPLARTSIEKTSTEF